MIFVKTIWKGEINDELLQCKPNYGKTRGIDVFNVIKEVFVNENIGSEKLVALTIDAAPAMINQNVDVVGQ